jgi:glycerol uptake facilitator-like aquaporin
VTIARTLTDSFAGIRPHDAPAFIAAQLTGAVLATALMGWLLRFEAKPAGATDRSALRAREFS